MSDVAGQSEFPLDEEFVRKLLNSQFPSLGIGTISYLGEGWDSVAFQVDSSGTNSKLVFRFPKRCERQVWVESEIATLRLLEMRPLSVGIPVPTYVGKPGPSFPFPFMGYRLLAGTLGDRVQTGFMAKNENARRLGELLTAVHEIDPQEAAANGVLPCPSPLDEVLAETAAMHDIVSQHLPAELAVRCRPYLEGTCAIPDTPNPALCLVHGDLVDEHILLDDAGRVTGVIDWGDSCLADPAMDFGGLYAWLGEDFVRSVLAHYAVPFAPSFLNRITFRARCYALAALGYSLQGRDTSQADRLPLVYTAFGMA